MTSMDPLDYIQLNRILLEIGVLAIGVLLGIEYSFGMVVANELPVAVQSANPGMVSSLEAARADARLAMTIVGGLGLTGGTILSVQRGATEGGS